MGKLIRYGTNVQGLLLAVGVMLACWLPAMPASAEAPKKQNVAAPDARDPKQKIEKPAAPPPRESSTGNIAPSRYVGEADYAKYVESLAAVLSIKGRASDPFGQLQDPDAKPIVKPTAVKATRHAPQLQATPFADIVRLIQVNTIMPKEKCFLVGTRSFKQGNVYQIAFRGRSLRVEIKSVTSQEIMFRNVENGDTASVKLNLLPSGMTAGTSGIKAPGMASEQANAPLELADPGNASNDTPINN